MLEHSGRYDRVEAFVAKGQRQRVGESIHIGICINIDGDDIRVDLRSEAGALTPTAYQ
jgi:hypothetical protein